MEFFFALRRWKCHEGELCLDNVAIVELIWSQGLVPDMYTNVSPDKVLSAKTVRHIPHSVIVDVLLQIYHHIIHRVMDVLRLVTRHEARRINGAPQRKRLHVRGLLPAREVRVGQDDATL